MCQKQMVLELIRDLCGNLPVCTECFDWGKFSSMLDHQHHVWKEHNTAAGLAVDAAKCWIIRVIVHSSLARQAVSWMIEDIPAKSSGSNWPSQSCLRGGRPGRAPTQLIPGLERTSLQLVIYSKFRMHRGMSRRAHFVPHCCP
jgi:hypothetical protein